MQPRKGLCRDVRLTVGMAELLSHSYKLLSGAARSQNRVPRALSPLCQNSCFSWPWVTLAVVLRYRMLPADKGNLLFPLAWQNLSLSVHILSGSQTNFLSHHIPNFLLLGEKGVFLPLMKPVVLPGCDVERREGKEDVTRETGIGERWLRWRRGMFQLQLCCTADLNC